MQYLWLQFTFQMFSFGAGAKLTSAKALLPCAFTFVLNILNVVHYSWWIEIEKLKHVFVINSLNVLNKNTLFHSQIYFSVFTCPTLLLTSNCFLYCVLCKGSLSVIKIAIKTRYYIIIISISILYVTLLNFQRHMGASPIPTRNSI